jgi:hypothetical protein
MSFYPAETVVAYLPNLFFKLNPLGVRIACHAKNCVFFGYVKVTPMLHKRFGKFLILAFGKLFNRCFNMGYKARWTFTPRCAVYHGAL